MPTQFTRQAVIPGLHASKEDSPGEGSIYT